MKRLKLSTKTRYTIRPIRLPYLLMSMRYRITKNGTAERPTRTPIQSKRKSRAIKKSASHSSVEITKCRK